MNDQILVHHGIKSQKWGNRRYQYEDGSLTPLGRIHYGVGEARDRAKIAMKQEKAKAKNEARIVKARAKAEADKIKAEANAYKIKKRADDEVEKEKIKAEREKEKDIAKENRKLAEEDARQEKQLENLAKEAKDEKSSSRAVKTVLGIMAAAGVGYLIYRAASHGEASASTREVAEEAVKKISDKPVTEVANTTYKYTDNQAKTSIDFYKNRLKNTTDPVEKAVAENFIKQLESSNSITTKVHNTTTKIGKMDDWIEKLKGVASMKHGDILVAKAKDDRILCHYGVKGMKWGIINEKEDIPQSGRTKNVTGTTTGATKGKVVTLNGVKLSGHLGNSGKLQTTLSKNNDYTVGKTKGYPVNGSSTPTSHVDYILSKSKSSKGALRDIENYVKQLYNTKNAHAEFYKLYNTLAKAPGNKDTRRIFFKDGSYLNPHGDVWWVVQKYYQSYMKNNPITNTTKRYKK